MLKSLSIFTGNSNRALAEEICKFVEIPLGRADVTHFSDGEIYVEIGENVRGVNCFVVQPTCSPPNQALMELLIMIDALKRASAGSIVAIIPYFGYARQDRKAKPRTPITAKLVANLITAAGADRALRARPARRQIQGFFDIPFDHLFAMPVIIEELRALGFGGDSTVVVSPDAGGVERARAFSQAPRREPRDHRQAPSRAERLRGDEHRRRRAGQERRHRRRHHRHRRHAHPRGRGDHEGRRARACRRARRTPVFSGKAVQRINDSSLQHVVVTNTIPLTEAGQQCSKVRVKSVGRLLGEAIKRIHHGDSISSLFV